MARGDASYSKTRQSMVWNARKPGRSPDAIVEASSARDVVAAVRFARSNALKVAVRGGGHNYHGAVLREGGLLVDLSRMNTIHIDRKNRRASVGPGVRSGELAAALARRGMAFPVGHCSDVALSGFLVNGGLGWNYGEWGPSCMSVRGVELVTAEGDLVYADADRNSDLFWAARGAGPGFFAVVTRFDLALYPLPKAIHTYAVVFDFEAVHAIAEWLPQAIAGVHPHVELDCVLGPAEGTPASEPKLTVSLTATVFADSPAEARARIASLRAHPRGIGIMGPVVDQPCRLQELFEAIDLGFPANKRMAGEAFFSNASLRDLVLSVQDLAKSAPPAPSSIVFASLGGGVAAPDPGDAAFSVLSRSFGGAYAFWDDATKDEVNRAWVRSFIQSAKPYTIAYYVGESDLSVAPERASLCFSPEAWARLVTLKKKYDPDSRFYSYLTEG